MSNYRKRRSYPGSSSPPRKKRNTGKKFLKGIAITLAAIACISLASSLFSRSSDVSKPPNSVVEPTDATSATQPLEEITFSFDGMEFRALEGMTWEEFCVSDYNDSQFSVDGGLLAFDGMCLTLDGSSDILATDVIIDGSDLVYQ